MGKHHHELLFSRASHGLWKSDFGFRTEHFTDWVDSPHERSTSWLWLQWFGWAMPLICACMWALGIQLVTLLGVVLVLKEVKPCWGGSVHCWRWALRVYRLSMLPYPHSLLPVCGWDVMNGWTSSFLILTLCPDGLSLKPRHVNSFLRCIMVFYHINRKITYNDQK